MDSNSDKRSPRKPVPTAATLEQLLGHYHKQLPEYQAALAAAPSPTAVEMEPIEAGTEVDKDHLIDLIRKQNYRLKRFIRHRSIELLQTVVTTNADGRTVGYSYDEILAIIGVEFPESSTSAAALRWYVVHLWSEADEEGLPRPIMPQVRPRSTKKAKQNG